MYGGGVRNLGVHFFEFWGPFLAFWVLPILGVFGPPGVLARFGGFCRFWGFLGFWPFLVFLSVVSVCQCLLEFERVMNDVGE